jgi:hypothetical protein
MAPKFFALALALNAGIIGGVGVSWQVPSPPVYRLPDIVVTASRSQSSCFAYNKPVTLSGTVVWVKYYGPPGWGETPKLDRDESFLKLVLDAPICTQAGEMGDNPETGVTQLQIMMDGAPDHALAGHRVQVTGKLMHSYTVHHQTPVLMDAENSDIRRVK